MTEELIKSKIKTILTDISKSKNAEDGIVLEKKPTIIGIIGTIASGKDTLGHYISKKLKIPQFETSHELYEVAREERLPITRENLNKIAERMAKTRGHDYLVKSILSKVKGTTIVTGMRMVEQIEYLREHSNLILISVDASPMIRFKRATMRHKMAEPSNLHDFIETEKVLNTGNHLTKLYDCMHLADYKLMSDAGREKLFQDTDEILKKEGLLKSVHNQTNKNVKVSKNLK